MPWHIAKRDDEFCVIKDSDDSVEKCHPTEDAAKKHMAALYSSETDNRSDPERRAPIEQRAAVVEDVNFPERTIEVLAAPYEQEAVIQYRGELWHETIERGAFDGVEKRPNRIRAYRDHEAGSHLRGTGLNGLIGRVVSFAPEREEGLMGAVKIAKTPLGDETLTLAGEGILGVSVGIAVRGSDQILNRADQSRRIKRAFVDHIAFPDNGAYDGAQIIDVRSARPIDVDLPKLDTPNLDEVIAWMEARKNFSTTDS